MGVYNFNMDRYSAKSFGYTDPDKFGEYLAEYLQTDEAKKIMDDWQQDIFGDTVVNITSDQLKKLTKELASSYPAYAVANGKADPTKMGDYFLNYLATADGKQRLMSGLSEVIEANGGYFLLYRMEKKAGDLSARAEELKSLYLSDRFYADLRIRSAQLLTLADYTDAYRALTAKELLED